MDSTWPFGRSIGSLALLVFLVAFIIAIGIVVSTLLSRFFGIDRDVARRQPAGETAKKPPLRKAA